MAMEELRAAALAYYENGTQMTRDLARSFFQSMDTNGDGRISRLEFNDFLQQSGYNWIINDDPNLFERLDLNGDGGLDFGEVLTFYYIIKTRILRCQGFQCGAQYLFGLYFTCVDCFDGAHEHTFDLCPACYRNRSYHHHHAYFLDNHVLLRSKRGLSPYAPPNLNLAITPPPTPPPPVMIVQNHYYIAAEPQRPGWFQFFRAFEAVLTAASVAANCTIM